MIELVKNFEIKFILECIKNSTDYYSYIEILRNMSKVLMDEQGKNIDNFPKNPKKYRVIIDNTDKFINEILKELGGYRDE